MAVDFRSLQQGFAGYIRDSERYSPTPDVDASRMAVYRELFFNNIDGFLSNNFPVLRSIFDDVRWTALVRDFFSVHACRTPYFAEIAEEFIDYLENERSSPRDYPFLLELAHYEWVEMALENSREELKINRIGVDIGLDQAIAMSPLAWPLVYRYPVHRIGPDFLPSEPFAESTCLVVYRNPDDDVQFIEITATTYGLLQIIEQSGRETAETILNQLIRILNPPDPAKIRSNGLRILRDLAEKNIVTLL